MKWAIGALALGTGCLGGKVPQAPECATYVTCIQAHDRTNGVTTNLVRFAEGGACWENGEIADLCTTGCARSLEWFRTHEAVQLPECTP